MGVNGLWTVVQPCARPTNLATLNRKRLAVDASIWIYQFLKAVRDAEGHALRNSHVVGFFRRICKLLWFGVRPVFVFDGGAPALKRATLTGRRRRREGRREDAARTAGKLLAVQMHRAAEVENGERRRRRAAEREDAGGDAGVGASAVQEPGEEIPSMENIIYADEIGMSRQERQQNRKFHKRDAYHLPELENGIEAMGKPEDPRIMSIEELEEYARQFHNGEDINLYDFSKIDFDGHFFKSLPPADRYNILNAARIRSRLRMGLSKDQLEDMFPDRMAFSRFQIERVRERNHLTQRLMFELGFSGTDLTVNVNARIAGDKNREYILVKNDGVEGGWALGVVSKDKDAGKMHKPIDVDALDFQYQARNDDEEWEDEEDFEDVPIEGLNRLPKLSNQDASAAYQQAQGAGSARRQLYDARRDENETVDAEESLFVDNGTNDDDLFGGDEVLEADEDEDINRAIALSLQIQHGAGVQGDEEQRDLEEDVPMPSWTQKAVEAPKPITASSGQMVAHIVNNRANASVRRRDSDASSDSEMDLQAALALARRKQPAASELKGKAPIQPHGKSPFGGPLPFEKLDWKMSIFSSASKPAASGEKIQDAETDGFEAESDGGLAGGFEREPQGEGKNKNEPRPLPPWMVDDTDIRESVRSQQAMDMIMNEEDEEAAREDDLLLQRRRENEVVRIDSSEDEDSDIEVIDALPPKQSLERQPTLSLSQREETAAERPFIVDLESAASDGTGELDMVRETPTRAEPTIEPDAPEVVAASNEAVVAVSGCRSPSPEMDFEDVELPPQTHPAETDQVANAAARIAAEELDAFEDIMLPVSQQQRIEGLTSVDPADEELFGDAPDAEEFDDFSDPEEEELLERMAQEAEEHARFASQLNNKSEQENQEAYERELRALRSQQKKDRRDADEVTQIMVTECQALLRLFGIPYITAPMEAEAQCAELVHLGLVDGIVTDDSDIFLFGGTRVYKNMFNSNKFVECYLGADLEKELSLSREALISLAQLLGSDYTEGLPGIGPVTAVEILSEFPGNDGLNEFKEWWQDVQLHNRPKSADADLPFRRKFRKTHATKLFLPPGFPSPAVAEAYLKPEIDGSAEPFQWGVPNLDGLRQFLMSTIGWSQERTDEVLVPVIKDMNRRDTEGTQSNITRYFEGGVGVGAKEGFAPRQRAKGSKRMANAVSRLRAQTGGGGLSTDLPVMTMPSSAPKTARKRKTRETVVVEDDDDDDDNNNTDDRDDGALEGNGAGSSSTRVQSQGKSRGKDKRSKTAS